MSKSNTRKILLLLIIACMIVVQGSTKLEVSAEPAIYYQQDFESFADGEEPTDWLDTSANNSMLVNNALFSVVTSSGNQVLGTSSTATNIHSHYAGSGSGLWSNYVLSGRMLMTDTNGGIGVTLFSDYNQTDSYYRLRRYNGGDSFHLSPHGTSITDGLTDSAVAPVADAWYRFKIEIESASTQTNIRAKVWEDGTPEPAGWQIDAFDSSANRLTAGTIGVWSHGSGSKYWDDLVVEEIAPPGPHTLTLNNSGNGSVTADPAAVDYAHGTSVQLTATPDAGWAFAEWSGDQSGNDNPSTIVMDWNKSVTAVFVEDVPQTVTTDFVGNGTVMLNPDQATYSVGDVVTVTAVPESGWYFGGWSGDLSGKANPAMLVIDSNKTITATFTQEPPSLVYEDFNSYGAGDDPVDWQDTAANNSMAEDDSLFTVSEVNGELALSTSSTASNIHSHYQGVGSAGLSNYVYTGRMMFNANDGGIGVTFFSDYNQTDSYYRLRRYGSAGNFSLLHISPHGTSITEGVTDSGVAPTAGTWYRFKIEVEDTGNQTDIRAKLWEDGTPEPAGWQINALDDSANRLTAGTVGVWSNDSGSKYWDDLAVEQIAPPGPHTLTLDNSGSGSVSVDPDASEYIDGTSVQVTATPAAGWLFTGWSGDLSGITNPAMVVMNGDKSITATFVEDVPQTVTTNVTGSGTVTVEPDQATYSVGDIVTVTAVPDADWYFGVWSGDLSGTTNPATLMIDGNKNITATFTQEPPGLMNEDFNSYGIGDDPADWQDTAANSSMAEDDSLFVVSEEHGELVFGSSSTQSNIHSHYQGPGSAGFNNYVYTGRMMLTASDGGIGLTLFSDYNQTDSYYRLRRYSNGRSFHLGSHGTSITGGVVDSGVVPETNTWYRFRIEAEDAGLQTNIRAKVWADGSTEPAEWQIDAYDSSSGRLTAGSVGVWSHSSGSKYWDDLNVAYLSTGPFTLTLNSSGNGNVSADPEQAEYSRDDVVNVTATPNAGWQFDGWGGDLSGQTNPSTITMSSDRNITALFTQVPTYTVSTSVAGSGSIELDPNQVDYPENTVATITAVPTAGWLFSGWDGDLSGTTNPATLLVDGNKSVTANFIEDVPLTLGVTQVGNGTTVATPAQATYSYGEPITVTATADSGWRFDNWQSDPPIATGWWDAQWSYRLPITVDGAGYTRTDAPVEMDLNFSDAWASIGVVGELDINSLRVIEVDGDNNILDTAVPFQFDPSETFEASTNAAGTLIILLSGNTDPSNSRTYHVYYDVAGKSFTPAAVSTLVTLTDNVTNEGLTTYRIENNEATYYYDKQGGGFSSIVDANGNDWINYNTTFGSAGTYRGIPNLVFPEEYMRPGGANVVSAIVHQGPLKTTIRSTSNDNSWQTLWEIYPDYARLTVSRSNHNYWFLYEGTPGGALDVNSDIVVRADGTQTLASEPWSGDLAGEEWVYFGDPSVGRSLFVANHQEDTAVDSYYAMENQMTVFGFGRQGTSPYLNTVPATFTVGLVDDTLYGTVAGEIQAAYRPLNVTIGSAETQDSSNVTEVGILTFNITSNQVVTATFAQLISPTLNVSMVGNGSAVVDPDLPQYDYGQTVTVTAIPDDGWHFSAWSGDRAGSSNPLVFNITDNTAITANFAENVPLTLSASSTGNGVVQLTPDQPTYSYGQVVTATAVADSGWLFDSWSGDITGGSNPVAITMDADKVVSANFVLQQLGGPVIDVWYGNQQRYGHIGMPQPWFNILGNVTDPDGVATLEYTLNSGAPATLWMGSNDRRLANPGDFNVDLHYQDLVIGNNQVTITATDTLGNQTVKTITVDYESGNVWPATYTVDWSTATTIEDVAQVVDGEWEIQADGVRILDPDYDRLVAIGDIYWTDYEVTVPITIHGVDSEGFQSGASGRGAGLGMLFRWNGHTDTPIANWQPKTGWLPYGAIGWYWWNDINTARLRIDGNNGSILDQSVSSTPPTIGGEYIFKMRVETVPNVGGFYQLKVWPAGQQEPATWDLSGQEAMSDPQSGSFMLLAHHIDATFGDVTITALDFVTTTLEVSTSGSGSVNLDPDKAEYLYGESVTLTAIPDIGWVFTGWQGDLTGYENPATINMTSPKQITATFVAETTPPAISNVAVTTYNNSATVTWNTDKPASSEVAYGQTSGYELGSISDSTLRTSHAIALTGLISDTMYHYQVTSVDGSGNAASSADATFTTTDGSHPSGIVSDDFNVCAVDGGVWSFVDPVGDGSMAMNGTQLLLSVPAGVAHDVWNGGNNAPRLMQAANDTDFEIEVKYESIVSEAYEMQGILVEQDADNYLRFDFYGSNGQVYIFAARIEGGVASSIVNVAITVPNQPMYMRIERVGDSWTQSYSLDGATWTTSSSFSHSLAVSQVGVFAGNTGSNPPHTAVVDYFFNTAVPVVPEDANDNNNSLVVNKAGNGSVSLNPEQALYACGETVELTAVADVDWVFDGWSGDLSGTDNPAILLMDSSKVVTATFVAAGADTTPPVLGNVQVMANAETATITWQTDEPASSEVAYGQTSGYELGSISDSTLRTSHAIALTGLISDTMYHYQVTSVDGSGNAASSADATFTTTDGSHPSGIVSDDFNVCAVDGGVWSFVDPVGDGSMAMNGTQLLLSVPAGVAHDVWNGGNNAPRLMQAANDTDFEIEVKYESIVSEAYEMQGILVEQDADNYLRFDFYGSNGQVYIFAARIEGGVASSIVNVAITVPNQPMYMRIERVGDSWTQSYSLDGATWTTSSSFSHSLAVSQVGVFAGNTGSNPPHTAVVDYFFNTAVPVVPEDANDTLSCT